MKKIRYVLPLLALLALSFVLAGCPKGDKMMKGDLNSPRSVEHIG